MNMLGQIVHLEGFPVGETLPMHLEACPHDRC
jgi:hypothetical protein